MSERAKNKLSSVVTHFILICACLTVVLPLLWVFRTAFANKLIAYKIPPQWIFSPTLDNFRLIFTSQPFQKYLFNSFFIAIVSTAVSIVIGSLAAYSLARYKTGGRGLRLGILATQMLPPVTLVIPIFLMARSFNLFGHNLLDTYWILIIVYLSFNLPFLIWILEGFFEGIPAELEEAGMVDGCTRTTAFARITVPLALPGMFAGGIFTFVLSWNEFLFALILVGKNARTLPIGVSSLMTQMGIQIGAVSAATMLIVAPIIILSLAIQKFLVRGLTFGAIK